MSDTEKKKPKKLNKLQAILQEKKANQEPMEQVAEEEVRKEEMAEVVDKKPKKKIKYKYKRVMLYMSYEDEGWSKTVSKTMKRRTKINITKSLLYSSGLKQLQKMNEEDLENLLIEEAKNRAVDLI